VPNRRITRGRSSGGDFLYSRPGGGRKHKLPVLRDWKKELCRGPVSPKGSRVGKPGVRELEKGKGMAHSGGEKKKTAKWGGTTGRRKKGPKPLFRGGGTSSARKGKQIFGGPLTKAARRGVQDGREENLYTSSPLEKEILHQPRTLGSLFISAPALSRREIRELLVFKGTTENQFATLKAEKGEPGNRKSRGETFHGPHRYLRRAIGVGGRSGGHVGRKKAPDKSFQRKKGGGGKKICPTHRPKNAMWEGKKLGRPSHPQSRARHAVNKKTKKKGGGGD